MNKIKPRNKLRNKIVTRGRSELDKDIKSGHYIEWLKREHGVIDMNDIILDKEFLEDMKQEIEKTRERMLVYSKEFKGHELKEWLRKNKRKLILRKVSEEARINKKEKNDNEQQFS